VFIGDNVTIGDDVVIYPGVKIYHNCVIGDRCVIHANSVIGSDGFGFAKDESGNYKKIPQTGNVVLENDVEIGSNTVIDRASMGSTVIKSGAKLDNLIQIAHNVSVGNNTAIAAQSGVAGSVNVGSNCIIGGQVGIAGHLSIGDGTMIQAQSGISSTVKGPNAKLYGSPAIDYQNYLKSYAYFRKFPDIVQQLRTLQSAVDKISQNKL
jgi:UDP-3-O-[3-hydroxymyristoyl] glucosamine N-acyltransferase